MCKDKDPDTSSVDKLTTSFARIISISSSSSTTPHTDSRIGASQARGPGFFDTHRQRVEYAKEISGKQARGKS